MNHVVALRCISAATMRGASSLQTPLRRALHTSRVVHDAQPRLMALRAKLSEDAAITIDEFAGSAAPRAGGVKLGRKDDTRLPSYMKTSIPKGASFGRIKRDLRGLGLSTVCEEARCPNIGECWGGEGGKENATATIMVRAHCTMPADISSWETHARAHADSAPLRRRARPRHSTRTSLRTRLRLCRGGG